MALNLMEMLLLETSQPLKISTLVCRRNMPGCKKSCLPLKKKLIKKILKLQCGKRRSYECFTGVFSAELFNTLWTRIEPAADSIRLFGSTSSSSLRDAKTTSSSSSHDAETLVSSLELDHAYILLALSPYNHADELSYASFDQDDEITLFPNWPTGRRSVQSRHVH